MEMADGGDLFNKIASYKKKGSNIPEKEIWKIFIQIAKGL
jgi:serine/threonine protein kinase